MPRPKAIRQRINYLRNKDIEKAPVAKTREQILFLFWDSGENDKDRILIFATQTNIDFLNENPHWFGDGTFSIAPSIYYQLYTINIQVEAFNLPLVYALLSHKDYATYMIIINKCLIY